MSNTKNPWDDKVTEAFEDEAVQKAVSDFLGKEIQPYVTQLEQNSKPNRDATRLWEALETAPVDTSVQVVRELFGGDIADKFVAIMQGEEPPETQENESEENEENEPTTPSKQNIAFDDLPPEVQNAVAAQQQETQKKAYYDEIERVKVEHKDDLPTDDEGKPVLDVDLFHPFVVAANGDFDAALEGFVKWTDKAKESFGIQVPENAATEEENDENTPPPAINSETRDSAAKPPTEKTFDSLDDALDSFFEDQKSPPPTVGTA